MHPLLLKIGPIPIHTYGFLIAIGFIVAMYVVRRLTAASKHTRGFASVRDDIPDLKVRRRCKDRLPTLPPLVEGQAAGARAMAMLAFALSSAPAPESN